MTTQHHRIAVLPEQSSLHPIAGQIYGTYPVGRQSFSRAFQGEVLSLKLSPGKILLPTIFKRIL
jgi:hypothetical protein